VFSGFVAILTLQPLILLALMGLMTKFEQQLSSITQDNHAFFKLPNQPLKRVIRDIGGGTGPPHDQPPLIEQ